MKNVLPSALLDLESDFLLLVGTAPRGDPTGRSIVWNVREQRQQAEFEITGFRSEIRSLDGRWLALSCVEADRSWVEVRDLQSGQKVTSMDCNGDPRAISPDGRYLVAYVPNDEAGSLNMFQVSSGKLLWKKDTWLLFPVLFSQDGDSVFALDSRDSGQFDFDFTCFGSETGRVKVKIAPGDQKVLGDGFAGTASFTPDGRSLLVWSPETYYRPSFIFRWIPWLRRFKDDPHRYFVVVFDVGAARDRFRLEGFSAYAMLSQDGQVLVTAHPELRCWDVDAGKPLRWAIGVPAGLGMIALLGMWWRGRRRREKSPAQMPAV